MMQQYEELISVVDIDIREEDKKAAKQYAYMMKGIKVVLSLFYIPLLYFLCSGVARDPYLWAKFGNLYMLVLLVIPIICAIYIYRKARFTKKTREILQSQCDPEHMISWCGAYMAYATRQRGWGAHFYNIGCSFNYAGRIEDAKKVVELMDKYLTANRDLYLRNLLNSYIDFYEKNMEELQKDCEALMHLSKKVRLNKQMKFFLKATLSKIGFLNLEQQGRYEELYEMHKTSYSYYESKLFEVMKNYYMYQAAKGMGKSDIVDFHRQFVLNNGGTLWYKTDIENECR